MKAARITVRFTQQQAEEIDRRMAAERFEERSEYIRFALFHAPVIAEQIKTLEDSARADHDAQGEKILKLSSDLGAQVDGLQQTLTEAQQTEAEDRGKLLRKLGDIMTAVTTICDQLDAQAKAAAIKKKDGTGPALYYAAAVILAAAGWIAWKIFFR